MFFEYKNKHLKISAENGIMCIDHGNYDLTFVHELPLSELSRLYPRWQALVKRLDRDLPTLYINNKRVRREIDNLLSGFGITAHKLSFNQIEALLFYVLDDTGEPQPSLLWRFHNVYPKTLDVPSKDPEIDYSKHIDLDIFELATLYLFQEGKEHLIHEWPLSRIMRLMNSKSFLSWASDPENKALLLEQQNAKRVDENPTDPEALKKMLEARMFGKG